MLQCNKQHSRHHRARTRRVTPFTIQCTSCKTALIHERARAVGWERRGMMSKGGMQPAVDMGPLFKSSTLYSKERAI